MNTNFQSYTSILKTGLFIFLATTVCTVSSQVQIIRDVKSPLWNKFDPMSVPDVWVETAVANQQEMPLPLGIDDILRKKIDAKRDAKIRREKNQRSIIKGNPTKATDLNPTIETKTDGALGSGTPNDNHIAVANDGKFISVMNTIIRVHNDTGKVLKSWSLQYFPNTNIKVDNIPALTRIYDPRVVYDPYTDRFIVLYMHGVTDKTSFIVVGFSQEGDPLKPWNVYKIPGKPINDTVWSDYPIVSQTKEDLFFTVNLLANGSSWEEGFREAVIWQVRKEDGYNGDTLHKNFFHNIKYEGVSIWSICAAQNGPMPDGIDNYFLSVRPYTEKNDTVFLHRITNTQKSGLANYELKVLKSDVPYAFPPSALQPSVNLNYKLRTNDARVLTAIRNGDHIQYMQNCMNFETMQAHLLHGHIYKATETPVIKAHLFTDDTLEFGYPAMAYASMNDGDPSTITTAVFSSLKDFPGMGMFYQNRYGEYSKFVKIKNGESLINYGGINPDEQRWGDYEGIQLKFNEPGVFYMVGSYGKSSGMSSFISRVRLKDTVWEQPVSDIRVFPVPSNQGIVNIEWKTKQAQTLNAELYLMNGQSVSATSHHYNFQFKVEEGTHLYKMHTHNLPSGLYQLKLMDNLGLSETRKIIIH